MNDEQNLVWVDLEMTGLNAQHDVILEIATIITNATLERVIEGPHLIIHQPDSALECMDDWVTKTHTRSGLVEQVRASSVSLAQAEQETYNFVKKYCKERKAVLAGNSVWKDKEFLVRYMPSITNYLHYRLVDVTSIKELVTRWYPHNKNILFEKKETHRALDDIKASIAELEHYRRYFFLPS